jgi:hypothetical protein
MLPSPAGRQPGQRKVNIVTGSYHSDRARAIHVWPVDLPPPTTRMWHRLRARLSAQWASQTTGRPVSLSLVVGEQLPRSGRPPQWGYRAEPVSDEGPHACIKWLRSCEHHTGVREFTIEHQLLNGLRPRITHLRDRERSVVRATHSQPPLGCLGCTTTSRCPQIPAACRARLVSASGGRGERLKLLIVNLLLRKSLAYWDRACTCPVRDDPRQSGGGSPVGRRESGEQTSGTLP